MPRSTQQSRGSKSLERDAALGRIVRTRRWLIAGAAGLTAAFAALVSAVAPGHSLAARHSSGTETGSTSPDQLPPLANPSSLGLQGPSSPPESGSSGAGSTGNSGGGSTGNSGGGSSSGNSGGGSSSGNSGSAPTGNSGGGAPAGNSGGGGVVSGGS